LAGKKKALYPGIEEAEKEKNRLYNKAKEEEPDFIGNAPNYDKFSGWTCERVLCWLNID